MAGHIQTAAKDTWNTPELIVRAVHDAFGGSPDLDPCSNETSIVQASREIRLPDDGLAMRWQGRVYANPPYHASADWIAKAVGSYLDGAEVIMLISAAVSAHYWHDFVWNEASRICFVRGRLKFIGADSTAPFPSAVVYYGDRPGAFERAFRHIGRVVTP